ncbi:MAG: radical SAM protein [Candidatus Omnitrophota bacterium]
MKTKCLLINPVGLLAPPFGLLYIGSVLERNGCVVTIKEVPSRHIIAFDRSLDRLMAHVEKEKPDLIGITCMAAQKFEVIRMIRALKERGVSAPVVVGGVHPSFMPDEVMSWGADYAVLNEGEETIIELLDVLKGARAPETVKGIFFRDRDTVRSTGIRQPNNDLDAIPLPAYHLLDKRRFTTRKGVIRGRWMRVGWIMTSRGCPSSCTFCSAHRMFGKQVRYRSIDSIFAEIDHMVRNFNIEALILMDDTFTIRKGRVAEFCRRIKREYPRLVWNCQARVNLFDEGTAKILKESNCIQVDFGVESGSQNVLRCLKKGINVEDTIRAFAACKKYGLRTLATIMVGNPDEGLDDLELTRELLGRIQPDFYAAYYTTPFPGTELYEQARSRKLIGDEDRYWHQYTEPVPMSNVESAILKKYLREFTQINVMKNYITNPVFLFDMAYFSFLNPGISLRVSCDLMRGRVEKALFLITNSVYFKKQG